MRLSCLRLEASLQDSQAQRSDLESELAAVRDENMRLRQQLDDDDARAVEAAQLTRINDLSRELIATRFALAKAEGAAAASAGASAPPAGSTASLGLDTLLGAAESLDLQAADAILNPACVLSTPSNGEAAPAGEAEDVEEGVSGGDGSGSGSGDEDTTSLSDGESNGASASSAAGRGATRRRRAPPEDVLSAALSRALMAVCNPRSSVAAAAEPAAATSAADGAAADSAPAAARTHEAAGDGAAAELAPPPAAPTDPAAPTTATAAAAAPVAATAGPAATAPSEAARDADATCAMVEALLLRGASANAQGAGASVLHGVCARRLPMAAAILLQHGADADARDGAGRTPLHVAASVGCGTLVEMLLRHGADATLATPTGQTAEELARAASDPSAAATLSDSTLRLSSMAKRASSLYRQGSFGAAAEAFRLALDVASEGGAAVCSTGDVATLHFNRARALLKESRHVPALESATAAVACRPDYANACMLQAECHMELLDFEAAASAYRRVSALEPHNPAWGDCAARAAAMAAASPYEVLGVAEGADAAEVKRAYKRECLQWHPDKNSGSPEERTRANAMFRRVTSAYDVLTDPRARAELDVRLRADAFHEQYRAAAHARHAARAAAPRAASPPPPAASAAYGMYDFEPHGGKYAPHEPPHGYASSGYAARTAAREAAEAAMHAAERRAPLSPRNANAAYDERGGGGGGRGSSAARGSIDDLLHSAFLRDEAPDETDAYDEAFDWRSRGPTASPWFDVDRAV
jgi:curved DNA-binding protein CbpA